MSQTGSRLGIAIPEVGLCSVCRHAAFQHSARGSSFWRCRLADADERLLRYPPLPVERCHGFAASAGDAADD